MANAMLSYRISNTEAGLAKGAFFVRSIPPPSMDTYQPFSSIVPRSGGGDAAHGYSKLTIVWRTMSLNQYNRLKVLVNTTRPGLVYVTFAIRDGSQPQGIFVDASGKAQFMQQSSASPMNLVGSPAVENVTLVINNITILNNPSNYS